MSCSAVASVPAPPRPRAARSPRPSPGRRSRRGSAPPRAAPTPRRRTGRARRPRAAAPSPAGCARSSRAGARRGRSARRRRRRRQVVLAGAEHLLPGAGHGRDRTACQPGTVAAWPRYAWTSCARPSTRRLHGLGFDARTAGLIGDHYLDAELRGARHARPRAAALAGRRGRDRPAARAGPDRARRRARALGRKRRGRLRRARRRARRGGRATARRARGSSSSSAASPRGGSAGSPSASPPTGSCVFSRRRRRPGSHTRTAGRRRWRRARSAWRCPARPRPSSTSRWGASRSATSSPLEPPASRSRPGSGVRPDGSPEDDPAEILAGRAGIRPFGGEQAHKGLALAVLVELLVARRVGVARLRGGGAPRRAPAPTRAGRVRDLLDGRRFPGDESRARREAAAGARIDRRARRPVGLDQALTARGPSAGTRRDSTRDSPSPAIVTP